MLKAGTLLLCHLAFQMMWPSQDCSTSEISLPRMCGARGPVCADVHLWAIGEKLVVSVTCRIYRVWLPCACCLHNWCIQRALDLLLYSCHAPTHQTWVLLDAFEFVFSGHRWPKMCCPERGGRCIWCPTSSGFFSCSVSCSELLLLHPAQSLPKSPRQCSMLLLSVILLWFESFEEARIDNFLILKS